MTQEAQSSRPQINEDFFTLIAKPISDSNPSGEYLRYSDTYNKIADSRYEENPNLPLGVWQRDLKEANWREAERLCINALQTKSKDLNIAAWLTDSWLRLDGIIGLKNGAELLECIVKNFWDTLYPRKDPDLILDDQDDRLLPFEWLNTHISELMDLIKITSPDNDEYEIYTLGEYIYLKEFATKSALDQNKDRYTKSDKLHMSKLQQSAAATEKDFYLKLSQDSKVCLESIAQLEKTLSEFSQDSDISLYRIRKRLELIDEACNFLPKDKTKAKEAAAESSNKASQQKPTELYDNSDAFVALSDIADRLSKQDPNSFAPLLIRKAVVWGKSDVKAVMADLADLGIDFKQLQGWLDKK